MSITPGDVVSPLLLSSCVLPFYNLKLFHSVLKISALFCRMVVAGDNMIRGIFADSAKVFNYKQFYNLNQEQVGTKAIRHFEVAQEIRSRWLWKCIVGLSGDVFSTWRPKRPLKQSHNALWQPSRSGLPRNLEVLNNYSLSCRNRPFPSSPGPLFQNEVKCSAFDIEIIFHSHANKTHFHKKGWALSLILKVRVFGTRKRPIKAMFTLYRTAVPPPRNSYHIGLLFTHKSNSGGAISVTERSCAVPISKVESHVWYWCSHYIGQLFWHHEKLSGTIL